jgi:hypothetical protein
MSTYADFTQSLAEIDKDEAAFMSLPVDDRIARYTEKRIEAESLKKSGALSEEEFGRIEDYLAGSVSFERGDTGTKTGILQELDWQPPEAKDEASILRWKDEQIAKVNARPDAWLYRNDAPGVFDQLATQYIRQGAQSESPSRAADIAKRVGEGAAATVALAFDGTGESTEKVRRFFSTNPGFDEDFISELASGAGSVVPSLGVSLGAGAIGSLATANPVTGAAIGATAGSALFNGFLRYNEGYQAAMEQTGSDTIARRTGWMTTPAAAIDILGDRLTLGAGRSVTSTVLSKAIQGAPTAAAKSRIFATAMGSGFVREGITEATGDITAAAGQAASLDDPSILSESISRAPTTFLAGGIIGGGMGGIGAATEFRDINETLRSIESGRKLGIDPNGFYVDGTFDRKGLESATTEEQKRRVAERKRAEAEADGPTAEAGAEPEAGTEGDGATEVEPVEQAIQEIADLPEATAVERLGERFGLRPDAAKQVFGQLTDAMAARLASLEPADVTIAGLGLPRNTKLTDSARQQINEIGFAIEAQRDMLGEMDEVSRQRLEAEVADAVSRMDAIAGNPENQIKLGPSPESIDARLGIGREARPALESAANIIAPESRPEITPEAINRALGVGRQPTLASEAAQAFQQPQSADEIQVQEAGGLPVVESQPVVAEGEVQVEVGTPQREGEGQEGQVGFSFESDSPETFSYYRPELFTESGLSEEQLGPIRESYNRERDAFDDRAAAIIDRIDDLALAGNREAWDAERWVEAARSPEALDQVETAVSAMEGGSSLTDAFAGLPQPQGEPAISVSRMAQAAERRPPGASGNILLPGPEDFRAIGTTAKTYYREAARFIKATGYDFAAWSNEMLRRFGDAVMPFLQATWDRLGEIITEYLQRTGGMMFATENTGNRSRVDERQQPARAQAREVLPQGPATPATPGQAEYITRLEGEIARAEAIRNSLNSGQFERDGQTQDARETNIRRYNEQIIPDLQDTLNRIREQFNAATMTRANLSMIRAEARARDAIKRGVEVESNKAISERTGVTTKRITPKISKEAQEKTKKQTPAVAARTGFSDAIKQIRSGSKETKKIVEGVLKRLEKATEGKPKKTDKFTKQEALKIADIASRPLLTDFDRLALADSLEELINRVDQRERMDALDSKRQKAKKRVGRAGIRLTTREVLPQMASHMPQWLNGMAVPDVTQPVDLIEGLASIPLSQLAKAFAAHPELESDYNAAMDRALQVLDDPQIDPVPLLDLAQKIRESSAKKQEATIQERASRYNSAAKKMLEEASGPYRGLLSQLVNAYQSAMQLPKEERMPALENVLVIAEKVIEAKRETKDANKKAAEEKRQKEIDAMKVKVAKKAAPLAARFRRLGVESAASEPIIEGLVSFAPQSLEKLSLRNLNVLDSTLDALAGSNAPLIFDDMQVNKAIRDLGLNLWSDKQLIENDAEIQESITQLVNPTDSKWKQWAYRFGNMWIIRAATAQQSTTARYLKEANLDKVKGPLGVFNVFGGQTKTSLARVFGLESTMTRQFLDVDRLSAAAKNKAVSIYEPLFEFWGRRNQNRISPGIKKRLKEKGVDLGGEQTEMKNAAHMVEMVRIAREWQTNPDIRPDAERMIRPDTEATSDVMYQFIEGGQLNSDGAGTGDSSKTRTNSDEEIANLKAIYESMKEAAGSSDWKALEGTLTEYQRKANSMIDDILRQTGSVLLNTHAIMRNEELKFHNNYHPARIASVVKGASEPSDIGTAYIADNRGSTSKSLRPGSSHERNSWLQPRRFDLMDTVSNHVNEVMLDQQLSAHATGVNRMLQKLRSEDVVRTGKQNRKWQAIMDGMRDAFYSAAGIQKWTNQAYSQEAQQAVSAFQRIMRGRLLTNLAKIPAEAISMAAGWTTRLGVSDYHNAVREHFKHKEEFLDLLLELDSTFLSRVGRASSDIRVADAMNERVLRDENGYALKKIGFKEQAAVTRTMAKDNFLGFIEANTYSQAVNYATKIITSMGDEIAGKPALYALFNREVKKRTGADFSWEKYETRGYDKMDLRDAMAAADAEFQAFAAPNTSTLVADARMQAGKGPFERLTLGILFPFSHFTAAQSEHFWRSARDTVATGSTRDMRVKGARNALSVFMANTIYQGAMLFMGKVILSAAGGADEEGEDPLQAELNKLDGDYFARKALSGLADSGTGSLDAVSKAILAYSVEKMNQNVTERVLRQPYDKFDDSIMFSREMNPAKQRPAEIYATFLGPYAMIPKDIEKLVGNAKATFGEDSKLSREDAMLRGIQSAYIANTYLFGVPAGRTWENIINAKVKAGGDPNMKKAALRNRTEGINQTVDFYLKTNRPADDYVNYALSLGPTNAATKSEQIAKVSDRYRASINKWNKEHPDDERRIDPEVTSELLRMERETK